MSQNNDREHFDIAAWLRSSARAVSFQLKRVIKNELGQMSVFLALVFQVLFVFFAMVINIGLLVHDKINLQNAVDLGAFYAAQRQAEILNEIAHLNYQIRQDYKLLAWRYWVVSTLGRNAQNNSWPPPARRPPGSPAPADAPWPYPNASGQEEVPVSCLAAPIWYEFARMSQAGNENYCDESYGFVTTPIALGSPGGPPATAAINNMVYASAQVAQQQYTASCENASPLSWAYIGHIMTSYKLAISKRKQKIIALRAQLVSADPQDQTSTPIKRGVEQTIRKNMTEENNQSLASLELMNGLSRGGCDGGSSTGAGEVALPEVLTAPGLYYLLLKVVNASCTFETRFQTQTSEIDPNKLNAWDSTGVLKYMTSGEPLPSDPMHSSLGYEKNPWCMAYVGVKATTRPRKPFAPFGNAITLEARAFAQPFGGRIGPWYGKRWTRGAPISTSPAPPADGSGVGPNGNFNPANGQDSRTDLLTSPRLLPGNSGYKYTPLSIPNFSRFPGDTLGLRSGLTKAMQRQLFSVMLTSAVNPNSNPISDARMKLNWFTSMGLMDTTGDPIAWDDVAFQQTSQVPPGVEKYRRAELSAIAPDLFDVTYYSIDPRGAQNYYQLQEKNPARYPMNPPSVPIGDLGTRFPYAPSKALSVEDQIGYANDPDPNTGGNDASLFSVNYWTIRDWQHLLTAWAPHRVTNFSFPTERFGQCPPGGEALATAMIPGKCAAGGRVGYSVRLISREHLNGQWQVGGAGESPGPLLNPPGDDTQF